jgi:hypothetical protein
MAAAVARPLYAAPAVPFHGAGEGAPEPAAAPRRPSNLSVHSTIDVANPDGMPVAKPLHPKHRVPKHADASVG